MTRIRSLANAARVALEAGRQRRVPFWSPARIERAQRRRLTRIVRHAWDTVPFWREAMEERGLTPRDLPSVDDLKRLPLIDGALFHARKADFGSTAVVDSVVCLGEPSRRN